MNERLEIMGDFLEEANEAQAEVTDDLLDAMFQDWEGRHGRILNLTPVETEGHRVWQFSDLA